MGAEVNEPTKSTEQLLAEAADHLRVALKLLDAGDAPAQIGAHVDLAVHQLEAELSADSRESSTQPARNVH
jgi:hypothetical protein